jgi:flagellar motor switch protein FliN/FliY
MPDETAPLSASPTSPLSASASDTWGSLPLFRELPPPQPAAPSNFDRLRDVELDVSIELGRTRLRIEDVLALGDGAVIELDRLAGDPVDVYVSDRLVARGEVVVVNDKFAIRVTEVATPIRNDQST